MVKIKLTKMKTIIIFLISMDNKKHDYLIKFILNISKIGVGWSA